MTVPTELQEFATAIGPGQDEVLDEMNRRAETSEFPTVGSAVGGWLQQLAGLVDAERIFEFGSGYGYSAYWFFRGMGNSGEVVLTEIDRDELEDAREYLSRGGYADRASFEHGDAIETIDSYDGPFDIVLIDNEKDRYVEALDAVYEKIPVGGVVVADNIVEGPFEFESIQRLVVDGNDRNTMLDESNEDAVRGIERYLDRLRSTGDFETTLLPLGEGLAVSRRIE